MKFFVNFLSIFRIIASFAIIGTLWPFPNSLSQIVISENQILATIVIFVLAAISDFLDGYLARKYNACTKIGAVLDSVADKFLIINSFVLLCIMLQYWFIVVPIMIMIARELYISGLREFLGANKLTVEHPKSRFAPGKIKAAMQMIAVLAFLLLALLKVGKYGTSNDVLQIYTFCVGMFALWFALATSIWSAVQYTFDFARAIKKMKK